MTFDFDANRVSESHYEAGVEFSNERIPLSPLIFPLNYPLNQIPACPIDFSGGYTQQRPVSLRPPSIRLQNKSQSNGTTYLVPPVDQLPSGGSVAAVSEKKVTTRRPVISTPIAKKKRKGKRLSRNKQADIRKRREAKAHRQLQSETVVGAPTRWYAMDADETDADVTDAANYPGMSFLVEDKI